MRNAIGSRSVTVVTGLYLIVGFAVSGLAVSNPIIVGKLPTSTFRFPDGKQMTVELAATPRDREIGLMFREVLPRNYGMLFVFPDQRFLRFWMKNTWVNLDMIFIDKDKRITKICANVPRSYSNTPEEKLATCGGWGQYVLELPAGAAALRRLRRSQQLDFDVSIPQR